MKNFLKENENPIATLPEYDPDSPIENLNSSDQESYSEGSSEIENEETTKENESIFETGMDSILSNDGGGIPVDSISQAPYHRSLQSISFDHQYNLYELSVNNESIKVLFPKNADLAVIDNTLVNIGSSNITGAILNSNDAIPLNTYISRTYTLLPATNANSNNNRYQYSAVGYITSYSVGSYGSLTSSQQYGNNTVIKSPNYGVSLGLDTLIIAGLLLALVLIQIIGGIFRR